jgi:hypothetical protein
MTDTTSIFDLPVDPTGGGNNIKITMNENTVISPNMGSGVYTPDIPVQQPVMNNVGVSLDQTTINSIVNGLQQASSTGATMLPSRDIPRNQEQITHDPQIQPNYIPPPSKMDYINQNEQNNDIISNYQKKENNANTLDSVYDELQTPILLCVLFFLFQLPFFKKNLFIYVPALFLKDGNYNIYGFVFISIFWSVPTYQPLF